MNLNDAATLVREAIDAVYGEHAAELHAALAGKFGAETQRKARAQVADITRHVYAALAA